MYTITTKDGQVPFRLSYKALKTALRKCNLSMQELDQMDLGHMAIFATESINNGYQFEGTDKTVTLEEVENMLDEDFTLVTEISEAIGHEMRVLTEPKKSVKEPKK